VTLRKKTYNLLLVTRHYEEDIVVFPVQQWLRKELHCYVIVQCLSCKFGLWIYLLQK